MFLGSKIQVRGAGSSNIYAPQRKARPASSAESTPDTKLAGTTATIYPEWGYKDKAENEGERGENDYSD